MRSGVKPVKRHHRDISVHKTLRPKAGAMSAIGMPADMPDEFDFDRGLSVPDQMKPDPYFPIPALPNGCTGETTAHSCGNTDGERYDPKYLYDWTRYMEGTSGQDVGCDIRMALKCPSVYGLAKRGEGENEAKGRLRGLYMNLLENRGGLDYFDAARAGMWMQYKVTGQRRTASVVSPWFPEWQSFNLNSAVLPKPVYGGNPNDYLWHNWELCGFVMHGGVLAAKLLSWQGTEVGDGGFLYLERAAFNRVMSIQYTGAFLPGVPLDRKDAKQVGNALQVMYETVIVYLRRIVGILSV